MKIKNLEYHKQELHKIAEEIKELRKDLGLSKRSSDDMILYRLLQDYKYWVTRIKTGKNINRAKYIRKRIKTFYKLAISKTFHQTAIVIMMKELGTKNDGENDK